MNPEPRLPIVIGLCDEQQSVARFFEAFEWEGAGPDAAVLSAEAFLTALGP